jgi:hypothetical protein
VTHPPIFEARPNGLEPWIWEVWDIEHPAECNHFPVLRVDSKGAADDFHEDYARLCAEALNAKYAEGAASFREQEAMQNAILRGDA